MWMPSFLRGVRMSDRRVQTYVWTAVALALSAVLLSPDAWRTGMGVHTVMETIAAALAAFVAIVTLVRYYARRDPVLLFVGTAFAGTALLDATHALITSAFLSWRLPSPLESLVPWSWFAARVFLPAFLLLGWAVRRTGRAPEERSVYVAAVGFMVVVVGFFLFVPLPQGLFPAALLARPQELLPGVLFVAALVAYLHRGRWCIDPLEHWLVLSLSCSGSASTSGSWPSPPSSLTPAPTSRTR